MKSIDHRSRGWRPATAGARPASGASADGGGPGVRPRDRRDAPACDSRRRHHGRPACGVGGRGTAPEPRRAPATEPATRCCPRVRVADTATSRYSGRPGDTRAEGWSSARRGATPPPRAERWGLPLFCDERLQRLDVERLLGHDLFQPPVFVLELLEPLHLAQLHPAVLRLPAGTGRAWSSV
jgi:hypothetical protein